MKTLDRRTVLRGAGTAIALPLLHAMESSARALAPERPPVRAVFLYVPNGVQMSKWMPTSTGSNYKMPETLQPIEKHRKKLNILTNLTLDGARAHGDGPGDHARSAAAFLTGAHPRKHEADVLNGISIDQAIVQSISGKTPIPSLELGLDGSSQAGSCDSGYSCAYQSNLAWRNATSPIPKEIDPAAVFDRLFASGEAKDSGQRQVRKATRKSVLDFALNDANALHQKLGAADRRKLDEYMYSVREIEGRLVRSEKLQVGEDGIPNYPRPAGVPRELVEHSRLMQDMIVLALQTDSTRVITHMLANESSNRSHPELGAPEGHHTLSHHGGSQEKKDKLARIDRFYIEQLAYLLDSLESIREGDSSLLDNCMLVYGSGISDGDRHNHDELPILLAGGAAGRLRGGRHIEYPRQTPLCNLYVWMLHQFGARADSFGDSNDILDQLT